LVPKGFRLLERGAAKNPKNPERIQLPYGVKVTALAGDPKNPKNPASSPEDVAKWQPISGD
jgi:hypothetical protein